MQFNAGFDYCTVTIGISKRSPHTHLLIYRSAAGGGDGAGTGTGRGRDGGGDGGGGGTYV